MDSGNRCQPDQYFRRVRPSLLGWYGPNRSKPDPYSEGTGIRDRGRALGASNGRIIKKHLLTNCIGTLIVTTTLQIPSSIFTESFLSFLGLGVAAPMPSLGSLASAALNGLQSYPHRLFAPALAISVIILSFNLLGDGLRDAFDPKLKD